MTTKPNIKPRERRTKPERVPGILRGAGTPAPATAPIQHGEHRTLINWRIFSGLMVVVLTIVILLFFSVDVFYVHSLSIAGLKYLSKEEIFRWANIADTHLFWVDADRVREAIMQSPAVADVQVSINWPPDMVRVVVTEREPALIWDQANIPVWVDVDGRVLMTPPEDRPDLLRVVVENVDEVITPTTRIPEEVISGALQLRELLPETLTERNILRYHPTYGLGFKDAGGWDAWFGSGLDMPVKIAVYKAIVAAHKDSPTLREINVSDPDAAVYCCE